MSATMVRYRSVLGLCRAAVVAYVVWSLLVAAALLATLASLRTDDFDGLNNLLQLPLALPWLIVMPLLPSSSHVVDAWTLAGFGWLNGLLLLWVLGRLGRPVEPGGDSTAAGDGRRVSTGRAVVLGTLAVFWVVGPATSALAAVAGSGVQAAPEALILLLWALGGCWIVGGLWRRWRPVPEPSG